ncbi:hypothetical protein [Brucella inopinata]|uniref:Uncharacterized protein n=1 Tax=Brucella inopinata TaxID=1218315 RepID=A0AAW7B6W8_9HYPH|nr:hypothetical protein [Brucella inopinata]KEY04232.1 hypothetical protein IL59_0211370 [Brucella suis bv. 4 str. 40]MDL2332632.1 hypothetical protein [Brucella inopinata]
MARDANQPRPDLLRKYATASQECENLIAIAKKHAAGSYDDLSAETIAHIIATARSHALHEDEEDRFDEEAYNVFESVKRQLEGVPGTVINTDTDRRWNKRQESLECQSAFKRDPLSASKKYPSFRLQRLACAGPELSI